MKTLYIACCIILGIALLPIAGGFYTLVRIAITIGAVIAAFQNSSNGINIWSIMLSRQEKEGDDYQKISIMYIR